MWSSLGSLLSNLASLGLAAYDERIDITTELLSSSECRKGGGVEDALLVLQEDESVGKIDTRSSKASTKRQSSSNAGVGAAQRNARKDGGCDHCDVLGWRRMA